MLANYLLISLIWSIYSDNIITKVINRKLVREMYNCENRDNFLDYTVLMESVSEPGIEIIGDHTGKNKVGETVSFLRFRSPLQTFGKRTLNGRNWPAKIVRSMMEDPIPLRLLRERGGIPGEAGHPVPSSGKVTIERIMTIDPERMCCVVKSHEWDGERAVYGVVDTLDDGPNGPGTKMRKRILQGLVPAFSVRCLVPQRKNPDGTIDVTGKGTFICHDNVIIDACGDCFMSSGVPVKEIVKTTDLELATESFTNLLFESSEKVQRIVENLYPALESATMSANGVLSVNTEKEGIIFLSPETKYRNEYRDILRSFGR